MWRKEDSNPQASNDASSGNQAKTISSPVSSSPQTSGKAPACVSQGIKIKGEVVGTEDLFIDGTIEGKVTIANSSVTVGPNGKVKAEITAREVVLRGVAEGKFTADERIQIWHTARVEGELKSQRISIEDGAELHGKVEAGKVSKMAANDASASSKKSESSKGAEATGKHANKATDAATAGAD
jgi:cytoskeletal protein CcmA (bactofilin family)